MQFNRKIIAEFIGTFILVFMGTGAIYINSSTKTIGHTGVAVTFGIVVMVLIYSFGHISGAHFNPAVSIGFFINNDLKPVETVCYCIAQISGAISGSLMLAVVFGDKNNIGVTQPSSSIGQAFVLEFILTFILVSVIFMSAYHGKANKTFAGITIGATVAIEALVFGPICGASMNPARSIGPAFISGNLHYLWIYVTATVFGAIASSIFYKYLFNEASELKIKAINDCV